MITAGPVSNLASKSLWAWAASLREYFFEIFTVNFLDKIASKIMFEKISSGKVKINIFKKYNLDQVVQAHTDLENRKILGPAVIIP